jgi:hypothetical protein
MSLNKDGRKGLANRELKEGKMQTFVYSKSGHLFKINGR